MKGLREKFRKNEGFTLVEMLIVVAIIAILIAVSIPLVSGSLERAREATDAANVRAAKAVMSAGYLNERVKEGTVKAYDAIEGSLKDSATTAYGKAKDNTGKLVYVVVYDDVVYYQWAETKPDDLTAAPSGGTWKTGVPTVSEGDSSNP